MGTYFTTFWNVSLILFTTLSTSSGWIPCNPTANEGFFVWLSTLWETHVIYNLDDLSSFTFKSRKKTDTESWILSWFWSLSESSDVTSVKVKTWTYKRKLEHIFRVPIEKEYLAGRYAKRICDSI